MLDTPRIRIPRFWARQIALVPVRYGASRGDAAIGDVHDPSCALSLHGTEYASAEAA